MSNSNQLNIKENNNKLKKREKNCMLPELTFQTRNSNYEIRITHKKQIKSNYKI
jgi:hypothetical protein